MIRDAAQLRADISGRLAAIDSVTALEVLDRVVRDLVDVVERRRDAADVGAPSTETSG